MRVTAWWIVAALSLVSTTAASSQADGEDRKATVALIKYLYEGYANGANARKSFFDTVPWDIETGRLIDRADQCQRSTGDEILDFDWPSDSQDPLIRNLSISYEDKKGPQRSTVRATFIRYGNDRVVIHYDMMLYQSAPLPRLWGVHNMRIEDSRGASDLQHSLADEGCKA